MAIPAPCPHRRRPARTAAALFAQAILLISAPGPIHTLHLAGGILTLAAGLWITHTVRRQPF